MEINSFLCETLLEITPAESKRLLNGGSEFSDWCAEVVGWCAGRSAAIYRYWNNPPSSAIGRGI